MFSFAPKGAEVYLSEGNFEGGNYFKYCSLEVLENAT